MIGKRRKDLENTADFESNVEDYLHTSYLFFFVLFDIVLKT